jgi:hypothetical protein
MAEFIMPLLERLRVGNHLRVCMGAQVWSEMFREDKMI